MGHKRLRLSVVNLLLTDGMYETLQINYLGHEQYDDLRNENDEQKDSML
jgi:hypothetical protein